MVPLSLCVLSISGALGTVGPFPTSYSYILDVLILSSEDICNSEFNALTQEDKVTFIWSKTNLDVSTKIFV